MSYRYVYYVLGGLLATSLISALVLAGGPVTAEDVKVSDVSVAVPVSCSFNAVVDEAHAAIINAGTYRENIGSTTFNVLCNDNGGYSIYAIGYTNSEYGNTKLLATVDGVLTPTYDIVTGTATGSNSSDPSNWAMKLTATAGTYRPSVTGETQGDTEDYTSYHNVPTSYDKVATFPSRTDVSGLSPSSVTATYAAYISRRQPAGTFSGKVKFTLVHPASEVPMQPYDTAANKIGYYPNASGVVDSMGDQTISATTTLWASNFKRSNYGFVGWSDKFDWVLNENDANGNGTGANAGYHIYGPNQTITLNTSDYTTKGLSLYAVWAPSAGSLQGWTGCSSLGSGKVTALKDQRDNDTYAVAKLADGNCWMIENLRLDYNATVGSANEALSQGYGGVFSGLAQPETANFTGSLSSAADPTEPNSLYYAGTGNQGSLGATIDILQENYAGFRMPRYRNDNTNTDSTINPNTTVANMTAPSDNGDYKANIYSYGNYYTWAAAMANTNYYNTTTVDADGFTPSEAAGTSLCPTGWKLPYGRSTGKGATSGGFYNLNYKINNDSNVTDSTASNNLRAYPNNFLYSGDANVSSVVNRGSWGYYWLSTAGSYYASYYLVMYSSYVRPGVNYDTKCNGYSVRCLAGS